MHGVALGVLRVACLVALAASSALYLHYLDPAGSAFCGGESGCEALRRSPVAYFGSRYVSLPLLGLVGFGGLFAVSLWRPPKRVPGFEALVHLFGLTGFCLLFWQVVVIAQVCWLCVVVDTMAMLCAVSGGALVRVAGQAPAHVGVSRGAWGLLGLWFVAGPLGFSWLRPDPAPPSAVLARYQAGKSNILELSDFECPYCRELHPLLRELTRELGDRAYVQRVHVPLEMHPHADAAAVASICAEAQGHAEAMDHALFTRKLSGLSLPELATELGLDRARFEACQKGPEARARLVADVQFADEIEFRGLPTTFIQHKTFVGVGELDEYRRAAREEAMRLSLSAPVYAALWLLGLVGITLWGRRRVP